MDRIAELTNLLGIEVPVVQAPMAGGPTTPELVAAVCAAGALGSLGAANLTPATIRAEIAAIRARTDRPFAINLFVGGYETRAVDPQRMLDALAPLHERFGIPPPSLPSAAENPFAAQLDVLIEERVPVASFTFGLPDDVQMERLLNAGLLIVGTATTVAEAVRCESAGCHAVVAQGFEAGGHRGTFIGAFEAAMIGTMALVPQIVDAVNIPVLAAGGIVDRRGAAAARALGASGVQCGTAFLDTYEAGTPVAHRRALAAARDSDSVITRAFSGRPARALANAFEQRADAEPETILPYPQQNALTRPLRAAAAKAEDPEYLSLWAGQAAPLMRHGVYAADVVAELAGAF